MESFTWSRLRQAAEVFAILPQALASLVSRQLRPEQVLHLSQQALVERGQDPRQLRATLRAFSLELQSRSGAHLPDLSRRSLLQLCRFHPHETAALLEHWLEGSEPVCAPEPECAELLERFAQLDWSRCGAGRETVACILLFHLEPEVSAGLFKILGPDDVYQVTLTISHLPPIPAEMRASVLGLFEQHLGAWESLASNAPETAAACLEYLIRSIPPWERPLLEEWTKIKLSGPSIAAILLDFLQPDWREEFLRGLDQRSAKHLQVAAQALCPAKDSLVEQLVHDFSRQFGAWEKLTESPEILQSCLQRVAAKPLEQPLPASALQWTGLVVLYGDLLEVFFRDKPSCSALSAHRLQLQSAWGRVPLDYWVLRRDELEPYEVVLRLGERELERFEMRLGHCLVWRENGPVWVKGDLVNLTAIEPEARIESSDQVLLRGLGSAQAQVANQLPLCAQKSPDLWPESLPGLAALRSFPANLLSPHLEDLDARKLALVAESLSELFSLSPEGLSECIRNSCLLSPSELMERAGLSPPDRAHNRVRISRVAVLLALAPQSGLLTRELLHRLERKVALQITERMMRLFYRWEERRLEPAESHPAVAAFLSWRGSVVSCPRNAGSAELADAIVGVWPFWNEAEALRIFREEICCHRQQTAQELCLYLQEGPEGGPWVPGPVLAAQFLHSLNATEELRRELCWRSYPVPVLPVDLVLLERAQQDWNRAGRVA